MSNDTDTNRSSIDESTSHTQLNTHTHTDHTNTHTLILTTQTHIHSDRKTFSGLLAVISYKYISGKEMLSDTPGLYISSSFDHQS